MNNLHEQLVIQDADYTDVPGILAVHSSAFVDAYNTDDRPDVPADMQMPREVLEEFVYGSDFLERQLTLNRQQTVSPDDNRRLLVARHQDDVIAFGRCLRREKHAATLEALYILPRFQRKYIGSIILGQIFDYIGQQDLELFVTRGADAEKFYSHFGFVEIPRNPEEQNFDPQMAPGRILWQRKMICPAGVVSSWRA